MTESETTSNTDIDQAPSLQSFKPWKLPQPADGIVYLFRSTFDDSWRIINDADFALQEATGYPISELIELEETGDYEASEEGELRAIYVPPAQTNDDDPHQIPGDYNTLEGLKTQALSLGNTIVPAAIERAEDRIVEYEDGGYGISPPDTTDPNDAEMFFHYGILAGAALERKYPGPDQSATEEDKK